MQHDTALFTPSKAAALARLDAFVPRAASAYAKTRNFDLGRGQHSNVSGLSPYLKLKLLDEIAVGRAVLAEHDAAQVDKFLTEVFWRTYWKGWMELRPTVWDAYLRDLTRLQNDVQTQSGLRQRWEDACLGRTGIAPFDAWAKELVETGYLHNHARMWFASIWIFTLDLPWALGADFFLRHLLDGDAAVNTLSWRWVAGIQTRGKTYLATAQNIAKFTGGRFRDVPGLAEVAHPVGAPESPVVGPLPPCEPLALPRRYGIMLHQDDIDLPWIAAGAPNPVAVAYLETTAGHSPWQMAEHVGQFRQQAAREMITDHPLQMLTNVQEITAWAQDHALDQIIAPYAPVGPAQNLMQRYGARGGAPPLGLRRRPLDTRAWALATKGFFPFRRHIPDLIAEFLTP